MTPSPSLLLPFPKDGDGRAPELGAFSRLGPRYAGLRKTVQHLDWWPPEHCDTEGRRDSLTGKNEGWGWGTTRDSGEQALRNQVCASLYPCSYRPGYSEHAFMRPIPAGSEIVLHGHDREASSSSSRES